MRAQMVAIGAAAALAEITSRIASERTGLPVDLVGNSNNWYDEKLRIGAECNAPTLVIDADLLFLRDWCPREALLRAGDGQFGACLAAYQTAALVVEHGLSGRFLNTGLMVIGPSHRRVFRRARELHKSLGCSFYGDEGPVNMALAELGTPVHQLCGLLNVQVDSAPLSDLDVARHYSGGDWLSKLVRMRQQAPELFAGLRSSASGRSRA